MTKRFFRIDYSESQWRRVINTALELGCLIRYNKYGTICTIDSTELETVAMHNAHNDMNDSGIRMMWAEHIFSKIESAKNK